jgi:YHS domain-containing protein
LRGVTDGAPPGGKEVIGMVKDPVCGMQCDEKTAAGKSQYKGKTYYFCAKSCKETFDKNPEKFAAAAGKK